MMGLVTAWAFGAACWFFYLNQSACKACNPHFGFMIITSLLWPICLVVALWELYQETRG